MKHDRDDKYYLQFIIDHCQRITEFTKRFNGSADVLYHDFAYQQAVTMSLVQIGENVKNISDEVKNQYTMIPWRNIADTRNFIVHDYDGLDCDIVWDVIINDIPILEKVCKQILENN